MRVSNDDVAVQNTFFETIKPAVRDKDARIFENLFLIDPQLYFNMIRLRQWIKQVKSLFRCPSTYYYFVVVIGYEILKNHLEKVHTIVEYCPYGNVNYATLHQWFRFQLALNHIMIYMVPRRRLWRSRLFQWEMRCIIINVSSIDLLILIK